MCDYLLYALCFILLTCFIYGMDSYLGWSLLLPMVSPVTNRNITKCNGNDKGCICSMLNQQRQSEALRQTIKRLKH